MRISKFELQRRNYTLLLNEKQCVTETKTDSHGKAQPVSVAV